MYDKVTKLGNSIIQHGKMNDRIYLQKLAKSDYPQIIDELEKLAKEKSYSKIFVKIPHWAYDEFNSKGFVEEASIPGFYNDKIKAHFMGKYLNPSRKRISDEKKERIKNILKISKEKETIEDNSINNSDFYFSELLSEDVKNLVNLYKNVFDSYPFPIFEEDYIKSTMKDNMKYFGVYYKNELIAASSVEMDLPSQNCEMTDFATNPEYRGKGLATLLLSKMEEAVKKLSIKTLYTIARSHSAGMNITFSKLGYEFSGTLIKNTNIAGNIESMNVWYKHI